MYSLELLLHLIWYESWTSPYRYSLLWNSSKQFWQVLFEFQAVQGTRYWYKVPSIGTNCQVLIESTLYWYKIPGIGARYQIHIVHTVNTMHRSILESLLFAPVNKKVQYQIVVLGTRYKVHTYTYTRYTLTHTHTVKQYWVAICTAHSTLLSLPVSHDINSPRARSHYKPCHRCTHCYDNKPCRHHHHS